MPDPTNIAALPGVPEPLTVNLATLRTLDPPPIQLPPGPGIPAGPSVLYPWADGTFRIAEPPPAPEPGPGPDEEEEAAPEVYWPSTYFPTSYWPNTYWP